MSTVNNKRIAKNTLLLYVRMVLLMGVSLYTSRVILQAIGVEDYGIYNLVGGFVTMFSIVTNTLVIAMQRYFNIALGQNNTDRFSDIFIMSMNILVILSIIIILLSSTVGVWFINNHLNLPAERMVAANWVFKFSVITFVVTLLRTPYNAAIIAYERMTFYAYLSVLDVILRLVVVYLLLWYNNDRLILYSVMFTGTTCIITYLYKLYCINKLNICRFKLSWDKKLFKELLGFTGWSLFGQTGFVLKSQGDSFLVNRFYSVAVNAAMGVNVQVTGAINSFVMNFQTAFRPQLTKSYATNEMDDHFRLLFRASKFSFFLLLILSLPVMFNIDFVLRLWLVAVPVYTSYFVILSLIAQLIMSMSTPFATSIIATGKIRNYQISLFLINIIGLFISFLALKRGFEPYIVAIVNIACQFLIFLFRLYFLKLLIDFRISKYLRSVILPAFFVTISALIFPYLTNHFFTSLLGVLFICFADVFITATIIYLVGFSKGERQFLNNYFMKFLYKFNK